MSSEESAQRTLRVLATNEGHENRAQTSEKRTENQGHVVHQEQQDHNTRGRTPDQRNVEPQTHNDDDQANETERDEGNQRRAKRSADQEASDAARNKPGEAGHRNPDERQGRDKGQK